MSPLSSLASSCEQYFVKSMDDELEKPLDLEVDMILVEEGQVRRTFSARSNLRVKM